MSELEERDVTTVFEILRRCSTITEDDAILRVATERHRREKSAPDWSDDDFQKHNERRCKLIIKSIKGDTSDDEERELERLQQDVGAWVDASSGIPYIAIVDLDEIDRVQG